MRESIEFHKKMLPLHIIKKVPQYSLLLPGVEGEPEDLGKWMLVPVQAKALDPKIVAAAMPKTSAPGESGVRVTEVPAEDPKKGEEDERPMPVSLLDLVQDLREATLECLYPIFHPRMSGQTIKLLRLFRRSWEIISGQPQLPHRWTASSGAEFLGIWKNLRQSMNGIEHIFKRTLGQSGRLKPLLLVSVRNNQREQGMLLYGFRGKWTKGLSLRPGDKIEPSDLDEPVWVPNPFYTLALQAFVEAENAFRSWQRAMDDEHGEDVRDQAFLQLLKKEKLLEGSGEYRRFWIRLQSPEVLRISLSLDKRPFLQQVGVSPIFILWDVQKYPVQIFAQFSLKEPAEIGRDVLTNTAFFVESEHPSILRHAFVRRFRDHSRLGTICTEATNLRIFNLLRRGPSFDPVVCFLEQMRAAARILKYGVRERDRNIQQFNPFPQVQWQEYQGVLEGWSEAKKFAREKGAEIIPYQR